MRDPKKAKMHLMQAHKAVKDGDGAAARHHVGHAFQALKEGSILKNAPETRSETAMEPPAPPPQQASLLARLKGLAGK